MKQEEGAVFKKYTRDPPFKIKREGLGNGIRVFLM